MEKRRQALEAFTFHLSGSNMKASGGQVRIYLWLEATTLKCVFLFVIFVKCDFLEVTD